MKPSEVLHVIGEMDEEDVGVFLACIDEACHSEWDVGLEHFFDNFSEAEFKDVSRTAAFIAEGAAR